MFDAAEIKCVLCSQQKVYPDEKQCPAEILLTHPYYIYMFFFFTSNVLCEMNRRYIGKTSVIRNLRMVPTFFTANTFCASGDTRVSYRWCLLIQGSLFKSMQRKQNLASALGIQKENWG